MLRFAKSDYPPVLPIYDSFIMQHAFGESDELEEDMRRAFYGFKKHIKIRQDRCPYLTLHLTNKSAANHHSENNSRANVNIVNGKIGIIR